MLNCTNGSVCSVAYTTELLCSIVTICHSESSPNILVAVVRTLQLPFAKILAGLEINVMRITGTGRSVFPAPVRRRTTKTLRSVVQDKVAASRLQMPEQPFVLVITRHRHVKMFEDGFVLSPINFR